MMHTKHLIISTTAALLVFSAQAWAEEGERPGVEGDGRLDAGSARTFPFSGSAFVYQNRLQITKPGMGADTIPYGMGYSLRARHNFLPWLGVALRLDMIHQLTREMAGDPLVSDMWMGLRFDDIIQPFLDDSSALTPFDIDLYFRVAAPTSQLSQRIGQKVGLSLGLQLSYTVPVLSGLELGVGVSGTRFLHEHITAQSYDAPRMMPMPGGAHPPESLLMAYHWNDGPLRASSPDPSGASVLTQWLVRTSAWLDFRPLRQLSFTALVMFYTNVVYELPDLSIPVLGDPREIEIEREATGLWLVFETQYRVVPGLSLALGISLMRNHIGSHREVPYSVSPTVDGYLDVRFYPAELVEHLISRGDGHR